MNDDQLRALLRLKRFEQPPEGYYQDLLAKIHERQRNELLRQSVFRIALDRIQTAFSTHSMSTMQFAGAMACLLVGGVTLIQTTFPDPTTHRPLTAQQSAHLFNPKGATQTRSPLQTGSPRGSEDLVARSSELLLRENRARTVPVRATRYVIDPRPASYEPSFSF
jgi:hypothetical protein